MIKQAEALDTTTTSVKVAIVGKYNGQQDSYLSIIKSLIHSGSFKRPSVYMRICICMYTKYEDACLFTYVYCRNAFERIGGHSMG